MIFLTFLLYINFPSNGLRYSLHEDGAHVDGFSDNEIENLVIPSRVQSKIGMHDVVKITEYAFKQKKAIKTVKIGSNIKIIGQYSFFEDFSLTSVKFEDGSKLKIIENNGFDRDITLEEFNIPSSVQYIGDYCFSGSYLSSWIIHEDILKIGAGAFTHMLRVNDFFVDPKKPNYCSVDGILYTKDLKVLLAIPCREHIRIIDSVEIIDHSGLINKYTSSVHLPYKLKIIKGVASISSIICVIYCGPKIFQSLPLISSPIQIVSAKFVKYERNFGSTIEKSLNECGLNTDILLCDESCKINRRRTPCLAAVFFLQLS